jgi:hypothetical protein
VHKERNANTPPSGQGSKKEKREKKKEKKGKETRLRKK